MILIVDSKTKSDIQLKNCFIELGLKSIKLVNSAQQARALIKAHEPNRKLDEITLIIIDAQLEDCDGYELCREFKKTAAVAEASILLLISSANNKLAIEKARRSGASGISVKPYGSSEFKKHLSHYIKTRTLMLVDDDPLIRKTVSALLAGSHMELIEIEDGVSANNLINTMLPTRLVLMDIGLPDISGIQLVEKIRSKPQWKKTGIMMLTASTDASDVKKSLLAGACQYIAKPFKLDDFKSRINKYLVDEN